MFRLALVAGTLVCVLGAIGVVVELTGDGHILVPAPEAAGEGFLREVETERFSRALPYLSEQLRSSVDEEDLRQLLISLEQRHGSIEDVRGDESTIDGDRAGAVVTIKTDSGEVPLRLHLRREKHLWKISVLP
jgi:hypothetical protein